MVCTGTANKYVLDEDSVCAMYIKNALTGNPNDFEKNIKYLKMAGFANYFFDPKIESHPEADFNLCMALDKFNFILKVEPRKKDSVYLKRIETKKLKLFSGLNAETQFFYFKLFPAL